jgi:DNA polymerase-3 subunit beta
MKVNVTKTALLKGIKAVIKAVDGRSVLPILKGIKIEAKEGKMAFTGTDLELTTETSITCEVVEAGGCVLDAKMLNELVSKLPEEDVTITVKEGKATIKTAGYKFNIMVENAIEFPSPQTVVGDEISLNGAELHEAIRKVVVAVADSEERPVLTGAKVEIEDGKMTLIALDGFRMAITTISVPFEGKVTAIIPKASLLEVARLVEGDITLKISTKFASFTFGETTVTTLLLQGDFVNWRMILPAEFAIKATISTRQLIESVDRAILLSKLSSNNSIKATVGEGELKIEVSTTSGDSEEVINLTSQTGKGLTLGFNAKYLLDGLKCIGSDKVTLNLNSPVSPCVLKHDEDEGFIYMVLPVRIK